MFFNPPTNIGTVKITLYPDRYPTQGVALITVDRPNTSSHYAQHVLLRFEGGYLEETEYAEQLLTLGMEMITRVTPLIADAVGPATVMLRALQIDRDRAPTLRFEARVVAPIPSAPSAMQATVDQLLKGAQDALNAPLDFDIDFRLILPQEYAGTPAERAKAQDEFLKDIYAESSTRAAMIAIRWQ